MADLNLDKLEGLAKGMSGPFDRESLLARNHVLADATLALVQRLRFVEANAAQAADEVGALRDYWQDPKAWDIRALQQRAERAEAKLAAAERVVEAATRFIGEAAEDHETNPEFTPQEARLADAIDTYREEHK